MEFVQLQIHPKTAQSWAKTWAPEGAGVKYADIPSYLLSPTITGPHDSKLLKF